MKQFIVKSAILIGSLLLIAIVLEALLRNIPNEFSYKKQQLLKNSENIEVLVMGNSHSLYDINPDLFAFPAFNLANEYETLDCSLQILKRFGDKLPKLKCIILSYSYVALQGNYDNCSGSTIGKDLSIYYEVCPSYNPYNNFEIFKIPLGMPLFNKLFEYYCLRLPPKLKCSPVGFGSKPRHEGKFDLNASGIERAKLQGTLNGAAVSTAELKQIIEYCKSKKVALILVTTPACPSYVKELSKPILDQAVNVAVKTAKSNPNVYYYNFLSVPYFGSNDFYDGDHLNDRGARKFSIKLNEILLHILKKDLKTGSK
jgi:hypothetical protein